MYIYLQNQLLPAREAFDAFLARYSYCYGYWKKYADFEKRNGTAEECEQVYLQYFYTQYIFPNYSNYKSTAEFFNQAYS